MFNKLAADIPFEAAYNNIRVNHLGSNLFVRISGSYIEIDITGRSVLLPGAKQAMDKQRPKAVHEIDLEREESETKRSSCKAEQQRYRTKVSARNIRLLINQNFDPATAHMLTVTFDSVLDYVVAEKYFKRLLKELKRKYSNMKFLAVIEPHAKGDYHMHVVINQKLAENIFEAKRLKDDGYIKSLKAALPYLWPHGYFHQKALNEGGNLGGGLGFYLTKRRDDEALRFKHSYRTSKNLERWQTLRGDDALKVINEQLLQAGIKEFYSYSAYEIEHIESLHHYEFCLDSERVLLYGAQSEIIARPGIIPAA